MRPEVQEAMDQLQEYYDVATAGQVLVNTEETRERIRNILMGAIAKITPIRFDVKVTGPIKHPDDYTSDSQIREAIERSPDQIYIEITERGARDWERMLAKSEEESEEND